VAVAYRESLGTRGFRLNPWIANEFFSAVLVTVAAFAVVAGAELARRKGGFAPELARKILHVGSGILVCFFPWLFKSATSVFILAAVFFLFLFLARIFRCLSCLSDVERRSVGELLFPISVGVLFWLSRDKPAYYLASLLPMIVPDAAAALVGKKYGYYLFEMEDGGKKSLEGSAAFFALSCLATFLPLALMTDLPRNVLALAVLHLAFLIVCLEGICVGGFDNLVVPLLSFYALIQTTRSDVSWISAQIGIEFFALAITLLLAWRGRLLGVSGFLTAQLYLYSTYAFGNFYCLTPPIVVYAVVALFRRPATFRIRPGGYKSVAFFWAISVPFAILWVRNFLIIFLKAGPWMYWAPVLPFYFAAAHGAGLACLGQIYRPKWERRLPRGLAWALWPTLGAVAALVFAESVRGPRDSLTGVTAVLVGAVGWVTPILQKAANWTREKTEAAGAHRLALSLALATGLALGCQWLLRD